MIRKPFSIGVLYTNTMKQIATLIFLAFSLNSFSQTQLEMNMEANEAYKESHNELNQVYKKVSLKYNSDTAFISALKKTQRQWISFRDAELEMKFPAENKRVEYGSVYPMCVSFFLKDFTDKRTERLRDWLIGGEEGFVCLGSIGVRQKINYTEISKAMVQSDSTILLHANMKKDHRIFGYQRPNLESKKVLLLSVFTDEVDGNPFALKHGAYYDSNGMMDKTLKFSSEKSGFIEVTILQNAKILDTIYFEEEWVEFETK